MIPNGKSCLIDYGLRALTIFLLADADTALVRKAWLADAQGMNYVLSTYVEGRAPLYPKIDSISFDKNDQRYKNNIAARLQKGLSKKELLFIRYHFNWHWMHCN